MSATHPLHATSHWSASYIGMPFQDKGRARDGIDCWGLIRLAFAEVKGISLPSYTESYASTEERAEMAALFGLSSGWPWLPVEVGQEREFDIVIFRRGGVDDHIGLCVARGEMLHVAKGGAGCIERFGQRRWLRPHIHRHERLI